MNNQTCSVIACIIIGIIIIIHAIYKERNKPPYWKTIRVHITNTTAVLVTAVYEKIPNSKIKITINDGMVIIIDQSKVEIIKE
jgi:hypothetical protein